MRKTTKKEVKTYLITDPLLYTREQQSFEKTLLRAFEAFPVDFALYRDIANPSYPDLARTFITLCKQNGVKPFLHQDMALAASLNAYGVHLRSSQYRLIPQAKVSGLFTIASAHSKKELREIVALGGDAATYSPIFSTPNKGEPKGLDALREIVEETPLHIIALGGIVTDAQINAVERCGVFAYASIRRFYTP
jgi:thiamine-phosphate pyrophosphorylase